MISAATVKELRERTGVGMMDCKRALEQCAGDMEKAIEFLREKGLATAAKKAGRVAKQGLVFGKVTATRAALVELNCETDFVAKNDAFVALGNAMVQKVVEKGITTVEALLAEAHNGSTVQAELTNLIATIGENMGVRRIACFEVNENNQVDLYSHGGGRIAVMVRAEVGNPAMKENTAVKELVHDLALQIVAAKAQYVSSSDISAETVEKERQIYKVQAMNEGKPENIALKMVEGRVRKFFEEVCLMNQLFIKDTDMSVGSLVAKVEKELGTTIVVKEFVRFEIGEGGEESEAAE